MNYGAKKDTLLDMLTHNLSGLLHLTQNIIKWMQENSAGKTPAQITQQLQMIESAPQECVDIVNDFLREEHTESGRIFVKKTRFRLISRVVATLDKLVATNKQKKFRLITDLKELNVTTDSVKFFQSVHNLVSNSIKFTSDGGSIDIIIREQKGTFSISVKDDGIGIPENFHKHIFTKNLYSQRDGLKNESSSGIGLHIVKTLVELMDGIVSFESIGGEGRGNIYYHAAQGLASGGIPVVIPKDFIFLKHQLALPSALTLKYFSASPWHELCIYVLFPDCFFACIIKTI